MSSRVIIQHACFTVLHVDICLLIQCMIAFLKSLKRYTVSMNALSAEFNFVVQFLFFISLMADDIDLNPGPKSGSVFLCYSPEYTKYQKQD